MRDDVMQEARGRWKGILLSLGLPEKALRNVHGPCPICGGKDRFRWDNKDGKGTFYCNQCGAGDGMSLLMKVRGCDFRTAVPEVRGVLGSAERQHSRQKHDIVSGRDRCRVLWRESVPIRCGDPVDNYLDARGVGELVYPEDLRFSASCYYDKGNVYPAMIAKVRDAHGKPVTLHRTYLGNGCKADVSVPRKMMPGAIPAGSAIRLGDPQEELGIAEGIETALAAMQRYDLPVWSAIDAGKLEQWAPPAEARTIYIFGDNDGNFTGQSAAFRLAKRLKRQGLNAHVKIPDLPDTDWADYASGSYRRDGKSIEDEAARNVQSGDSDDPE